MKFSNRWIHVFFLTPFFWLDYIICQYDTLTENSQFDQADNIFSNNMGTGTRIYLSKIKQNGSENEGRIREIISEWRLKLNFERNHKC